MAMPLAASYVGFDFRKDKVNRSPFDDSWYTILANIYGVSRGEVEQRDKRRQVRNRNLTRAEWKQYLGDIEPYRATCPGLPIEEKPVEGQAGKQ